MHYDDKWVWIFFYRPEAVTVSFKFGRWDAAHSGSQITKESIYILFLHLTLSLQATVI